MKQYLFVLVAMMVLGLAASCGDETTTINGPVPVEMQGPVVNYDVPVCTSDADCGDLELCMLDATATESVGHTIMVCVIGCDAELETIEVKNEDGTSSQVTSKVEGTDTCQRFGDTSLFCDLTSHECKEYSAEEPVVEPTEPVVEPETAMTELMCCYDGHLTGLYGAFAWSMSTPTDPEKWTGVRDLSLDASGCFNTLVDMNTVFLGFLVDMTYGPSKGKSDEDIKWVATALKPTECYIDGEAAQIGGFNNGWKFGLAARK